MSTLAWVWHVLPVVPPFSSDTAVLLRRRSAVLLRAACRSEACYVCAKEQLQGGTFKSCKDRCADIWLLGTQTATCKAAWEKGAARDNIDDLLGSPDKWQTFLTEHGALYMIAWRQRERAACAVVVPVALIFTSRSVALRTVHAWDPIRRGWTGVKKDITTLADWRNHLDKKGGRTCDTIAHHARLHGRSPPPRQQHNVTLPVACCWSCLRCPRSGRTQVCRRSVGNIILLLLLIRLLLRKRGIASVNTSEWHRPRGC